VLTAANGSTTEDLLILAGSLLTMPCSGRDVLECQRRAKGWAGFKPIVPLARLYGTLVVGEPLCEDSARAVSSRAEAVGLRPRSSVECRSYFAAHEVGANVTFSRDSMNSERLHPVVSRQGS